MEGTGATTLRLARPASETGQGGENRLAELVAHLTGCAPTAAVEAIERARPSDDELSVDERLEVVAQAIVAVKREQRLDLRDHHPVRRPA